MATLGDVGAGHTLGRYELLTPIAQGGMALVWAARSRGSRNFQKIVAIKSMLPQLSDDPQFEKMFLAEAELTARIKHPNVCEVLDLGEEDGTLYIVMEWVNGESLSTLMKTAAQASGIPVAVAVSLARDAALGLHAAHELRGEDGELIGLVHRDVSPQNILVTFDGVVKIVDFGIAKATAQTDDEGKTQAGQVKGKIPYMAPEQPAGINIDRRTDIFALGTILYQMVTGKHPFRQEHEMATLRRLCEPTPLARASTVAPGLPPQLDDVIARATEKSPRKRYQTMAEFAAALDDVRRELAGAGGETDAAAFVQGALGGRLKKKKAVIKEALRLADNRATAPFEPMTTGTHSAVTGTSGVSLPGEFTGPGSVSGSNSGPLSGLSGVSGLSGLSGLSGVSGLSSSAGAVAPGGLAEAPSSLSTSGLVGSHGAVVADAELVAPPRRVGLWIGVAALAAGLAGASAFALRGPAMPAPAASVVATVARDMPGAPTSAAVAPSTAAAPSAAPLDAPATPPTEPSASASSSARAAVRGPRRAPTAPPTAPTAPPANAPKVSDPGF